MHINTKVKKILHKIEDHMLLGSVYDNIMLKIKYNTPKLSSKYKILIAQKHRMLYYKKLKKKFYSKCTVNRPWEAQEKNNNSDIIWLCWLQGYENAPLLVKRCYESIKKNAPNKEVIFLDKKNIFDYVTLPDYIIDKFEQGKIGHAHFSDILRLELLTKHGGYWIDSTVLCTDKHIFEYIDEEPLFMYSFYYFGFTPEIMELNNWFIKSCTNNNILSLTKNFLYEYWKVYNRDVHYFFLQIFLSMATEYYEDEYKRMPLVSQVDSHILATYIGETFDKKKFDMLKSSTGIHKLSTRFDKQLIKNEGTFYDEIINKGNY